MANKIDLENILCIALHKMGNQGSIIEICKWVWNNYADELEKSGDLYFTWQYDIRWAATSLRKKGKILPAELSPKGIWVLIH
jgi:hypothetical protein